MPYVPPIPTRPTVRRRARSLARGKPSDSTARLEARIPRDLKILIETAAPLAGHTSVTDYLVHALQESASRTVEQSRRSQLDAQQARKFVQSLLEPSNPPPALRSALVQYRAQVG